MALAPTQPRALELGTTRIDRCIIAWLLLTIGFVSWTSEPTRQLWNELDCQVFEVSNAALVRWPAWRAWCAASNSKSFDVLAAALTVCLWVAAAQTRRQSWKVEWLDLGLLIFATLIARVVITHLMLGAGADLRRISPTLTLEGVRLSELEQWVHTKDSSHYCFPSDHGLVVLAVAAHVMIFAPTKRLLAALYALVFTTPRIFAGAHWLSDVAVGSVFITVTAMTLVVLGRGWLLKKLGLDSPSPTVAVGESEGTSGS